MATPQGFFESLNEPGLNTAMSGDVRLSDIRVMLAESRQADRVLLRDLLVQEHVHIVAECTSGTETLQMIQLLRPDAVFLDIHLPDLDGISLSNYLTDPRPKIIFTSTEDEFAVRAFEAKAFDYLLKPFNPERVLKSLRRIRQEMEDATSLRRQLSRVVKAIRSKDHVQRLVFKSKGKIVFVNLHDVRWIEAEGNYARLHLASESHLLRETMARLEARLDPDVFLRIHRSTIVNLSFVKEIHPWIGEGESLVLLEDGTRLSMSRGYRQMLEKVIGQ